jgi:diaminopimelate decarboxylase
LKPVEYRDRSLYCESVSLAEVAKKEGTPCYVYSSKAILDSYNAYDQAFGQAPHTVCYAVKANGNLSILKLLAGRGAGFDIVSGGELFRVIRAGGDPSKVVFSGVGKTADEINNALDAGIHTFNCESEPELALLDALAHRKGIKARVALRVNPDVEASTHAYISTGKLAHKFGVNIGDAEAVYERARGLGNLLFEGVSCHIGSQILDTEPMFEAVDRVLALMERLRAKGFPIQTADLGGGLGVAYNPEQTKPEICRFVKTLCAKVGGRNLKIMIEPGRSIVGDAGILLTRVLYRKRTGDKEFVIVDAGMNDLIRPALYSAHHEILPVRQTGAEKIVSDIVGPVCETGDFLARDRFLPEPLPGDLLAVCTAGAYGFSQTSNYNGRPRPAEVMIDGSGWKTVRKRETFEDLVRGE